jgi:hypothetical protein
MGIFRQLGNFFKFDDQKSTNSARTYHDLYSRFKFTLAGQWQDQQPFNTKNPEFVGPDGAVIKFAIGPISPEPDYQEHMNSLKRIAAKYGHEILKVGSIEVDGKRHASVVCQVPISQYRKLRLKNYHLIFSGIEYVITALLATVDSRFGQTRVHEQEESYDSIVTTFRALEIDSNPEQALQVALSMYRAGGFSEAAKILKSAVAKMPHSNQCTGETAQQKFDLLLLWADVTRKWTGDAQIELDILNDCLPLVDKLPPPMLDQLSNDAYTSFLHMNRAYLLHANRARALSRLGLLRPRSRCLSSGASSGA